MHGPGGYFLEGVQVMAIAKNSKVWRKYEQVTNKMGKARLAFLPKGEYLVHFTKKGYDRGFRKVEITEETEIDVRVPMRIARPR